MMIIAVVQISSRPESFVASHLDQPQWHGLAGDLDSVTTLFPNCCSSKQSAVPAAVVKEALTCCRQYLVAKAPACPKRPPACSPANLPHKAA